MPIKKNILKNTVMLYGLTAAKIVFPLLTLPYLTRVLSTETYGVVAYVKNVMQYMQIILDFGFMTSGTKAIVEVRNDMTKIGKVSGDILIARLMLSAVSFIALLIMVLTIPILRANALYTILSFVTVFLSIFLFDYLFRGLEKMEVITVRFIVMRGIATLMTFVMIHKDTQILWIPILDIVGSLLAVMLVWLEMKKIGIQMVFTSIKDSTAKLIESANYFISNMATTAFGALNTLLIGIFMSGTDVAYWSVCMQIVGAIQTMYNPITDGIYPEMVKSKDVRLIKNTLKLFMPIIAAGCVIVVAAAPIALTVVGGAKYTAATPVLRMLVPVLFFSFPGMLLGWPTLGAIDKSRQVMVTTFATAFFQIAGLLLLGLIGHFTLMSLSILRSITECVMMLLRFSYFRKYRREFN